MTETTQRSVSDEGTVATSDSSAGAHSGSDSTKEITIESSVGSGRQGLYERIRHKQVLWSTLLAAGILAVTFMVVKVSMPGRSTLSGMNTDSDTDQPWGEARAATTDDETPFKSYYLDRTVRKEPATREEMTTPEETGTTTETALPQPSPVRDTHPDANERQNRETPANQRTTSRARLGGDSDSGTGSESADDESADDKSADESTDEDGSTIKKTAPPHPDSEQLPVSRSRHEDDSVRASKLERKDTTGVTSAPSFERDARAFDSLHTGKIKRRDTTGVTSASSLQRDARARDSLHTGKIKRRDTTGVTSASSLQRDARARDSIHTNELERKDATGVTSASSLQRDARALDSIHRSEPERNDTTGVTSESSLQRDARAVDSIHRSDLGRKDITGVTSVSPLQRDDRALGARGETASEAVRVAYTGSMPRKLKKQATATAGNTSQRRKGRRYAGLHQVGGPRGIQRRHRHR